MNPHGSLAFLLLLASAPVAQSIGSSTSLPPGSPTTHGSGAFADVLRIALTPDAQQVLYLADSRVDEQVELFALRASGGGQRVLSGNFAAGRAGVVDFVVTHDARHVLLLADHAARGRYELYSAALADGLVTKIDRPAGSRGSIPIDSYRLTPNGRHVLFANKPSTGPTELWIAPLDGGPGLQLSDGRGVVNGNSIRVTPDGLRVVYQSMTGVGLRIFSARIDGRGTPVELASVGSAFGYEPCTTTNSTVLFGGGSAIPGLFARRIDGRSPALDLSLLAPDERASISYLTPSERTVVYLSYEGVTTGQIMAVPFDGSSTPRQLSANPSGGLIAWFRPSASGRVAFAASAGAGAPFELQSAALDASAAPVVLSLPGENLVLSIPGRAGGYGPIIKFLSSGRDVLFASTDLLGSTSVWRTALDGSTSPGRLATLSPGGSIAVYLPFFSFERDYDLDVDPLGSRLVYLERDTVQEKAKLMSVPLDGSTPSVELSHLVATGAHGPRMFATSFQTGKVYYADDSAQADVYELYEARLDGSRAPRLLVDF